MKKTIDISYHVFNHLFGVTSRKYSLCHTNSRLNLHQFFKIQLHFMFPWNIVQMRGSLLVQFHCLDLSPWPNIFSNFLMFLIVDYVK